MMGNDVYVWWQFKEFLQEFIIIYCFCNYGIV